MQKPQAYDRQGFVGVQFSTIVPQTATTNQLILEISKYISSGCFTEAVDLVEKRHFTGDAALFIIANLQNLEVAR